jgi:hypothetical protein
VYSFQHSSAAASSAPSVSRVSWWVTASMGMGTVVDARLRGRLTCMEFMS